MDVVDVEKCEPHTSQVVTTGFSDFNDKLDIENMARQKDDFRPDM